MEAEAAPPVGTWQRRCCGAGVVKLPLPLLPLGLVLLLPLVVLVLLPWMVALMHAIRCSTSGPQQLVAASAVVRFPRQLQLFGRDRKLRERVPPRQVENTVVPLAVVEPSLVEGLAQLNQQSELLSY